MIKTLMTEKSKKRECPTTNAFLSVDEKGRVLVTTDEYDCGMLNETDSLSLALIIILSHPPGTRKKLTVVLGQLAGGDVGKE